MGWSRFWRRTRRDDELAEELESYLAHEAGERITDGAASDDARHAALRKLGNPTRVRENGSTRRTRWRLSRRWRKTCATRRAC